MLGDSNAQAMSTVTTTAIAMDIATNIATDITTDTIMVITITTTITTILIHMITMITATVKMMAIVSWKRARFTSPPRKFKKETSTLRPPTYIFLAICSTRSESSLPQ